METNKVTSKGQTTITVGIRNALNLSTGDELLFELEGDQVLLRKASVIDLEYLDFSFFSSRKRKR
ncbi:MAG: AbrB family looped-hinge helix DNA binding protein [Halioglobus sp.]|jgi:AbrB family looped-hinge helix DNA binding protein